MKNITKYLLTFLILNSTFLILKAQVGINENGDDPDPSAMLDVSSTDKGLLIPRMDSTARNSIAAPADGLLVYDNSTTTYWYYDNGKWNEIRNGSTAISYLDFAESLPEEDLDLSCSTEVEERTLGSFLDDTFIAGNFMYAIDEASVSGLDSFFVFDVHDPLNPTLITGIESLPDPFEVLVSGQYAYIIHNEESNNFTVIDISDPQNPIEVANITVGSRPRTIDIEGNYAYVIDENSDLIFVNISDPTAPVVEGNSIKVNLGSAADLAVKNDFAYVLADVSSEQDIKVIDISDISNPIAIDTLDLGGNPRELKIVDNYAYLINFTNQELVVIDIADPSNLSMISNTNLGASPRELRIANGYAFIATGNTTGGFKIVDISDPVNPVIESDLSVIAAALSLNVFGSYVYIHSSDQISIVPITPCDPFYVGVNSFSGELFVVNENDNLGNHTATENIQLSDFYLSNDGGNEGILINDNGKVSVDSLRIADAYTMPAEDGTANQIISTDGSGNLSWSANNGAFNSESGLTFSLNENDDFVFGADSLNYGSGTETKFFFDREKGAFRAGAIGDKSWDQDSLGTYSIALGLDTKATALNSVAIGPTSIATNDFAISFGSNNEASGNTSNALGHNNTASGNNSNAFGSVNTASGSFSSAFGAGSTASGNTSAALGYLATAEGSSSTALGFAAIASGFGSYALGAGANAKGYFSTTLGRETVAYSFGETAVGLFNTEYTPIDSTAFAAEDRLFVIGNGTDLDNPSDALRIYKNGNVELNGALTIDSSYTFPTTDGTAGQFLQTDGSGNLNWVNETLDNLGDHSATQNLQLADNWVSNDGESEGININDDGNVGIGVDPTDATLSVRLGTDGMEVEAVGNTIAGSVFGDVASVWQSYTATTSGVLLHIQLRFATATGTRTVTLYSGEGTDGAVLGTSTADVKGTGVYQISFDFSADNIKQTSGNIYTIGIDNRNDTYVSTSNSYDGGINSNDPEWDLFFRTFIESYNTGFQVGGNGVVINDYTLPLSDGAANQVLTTDGSGSLSWTDQTVDTDTDDQELSFNTTTKVLSIDDGNSVDLSSIDTDTDTDDQELSFNTTTKILSIDDGNSVDLSSIDTDTDTDDQSLSLSGSFLNIDDGTGVDLATLKDDLGDHTASQNIELSNNWLSNDGGGEGIRIDNDGNVGIGTSSPAALLDLSDGSGDDAVLLRFNTERSWQFEQTGTGSNNTLFLQSSSSGKNFNILSDDGTPIASFRSNGGNSNRVGINTTVSTSGEALEVNGGASKTVPGSWSGNSDKRLKKNIEPLNPQQTLNKLLSLQGVTYEWNDNKTGYDRPEGIQYGFTAQNIQAIFPSLVSEDGNGYLQTAYGTYDAMYVEALRALKEENETLKEKVQVLETQVAKINQLEAMLEQLQAQVNSGTK